MEVLGSLEVAASPLSLGLKEVPEDLHHMCGPVLLHCFSQPPGDGVLPARLPKLQTALDAALLLFPGEPRSGCREICDFIFLKDEVCLRTWYSDKTGNMMLKCWSKYYFEVQGIDNAYRSHVSSSPAPSTFIFSCLNY